MPAPRHAALGATPRRRILPLCRTRGAAPAAAHRFGALLSGRADARRPLRHAHALRPAAGGTQTARTALRTRTDRLRRDRDRLPPRRSAAPRGSCGAEPAGHRKRRRRCGIGRRPPQPPLPAGRAAPSLPHLGAHHRPQLQRGRPIHGRAYAHPGLENRRRSGPAHGTRPTDRGRLHPCRDPRASDRTEPRRCKRTFADARRTPHDAGHPPLVDRGGLRPDGRPALQSGMGLPAR